MGGYNKFFKDGKGGLRGGPGAKSGAFESSEKRSATSVWDDSVPVGYWNFEDGSGTTLSDVSSAGNNLDGTLKGTSDDFPDWDTTHKVRGDSSLNFVNGSSQAVWMADNNVLDFTADDSFTLSGWFKRRSVSLPSTQACIMAKMSQYPVGGSGEPAYRGYTLWLENGKTPYFLFYQDGSNFLRGYYNHSISDANWHHIVLTYDGTTDISGVKIYLDGSDVGALVQTADSLDSGEDLSSQTDFSIGAFGKGGSAAGTTRHWDGNIDEVAVWDRELSSDEVADVYNSGAANDLTNGIPKS